MFDSGVHPMLARVFDPPRPVWVDMDVLVSPERGRAPGMNEVPMIVKARGIDLSQPVEGLQHAWLRSKRGQWLAVVEYTVSTAVGELPVQQLAPRAAVRLRAPETRNTTGRPS